MSEYIPRATFPHYLDRLQDRELTEMVRAYLESAEWCGLSECDEHGVSDRSRFDRCKRPRWSAKAVWKAGADCRAFLDETEMLHSPGDIIGDVDVSMRQLIREHGSFSQAGRDFYLTRNHHGAGFWDGNWPADIGQVLTRHSHPYGPTQHYFDRGLIRGE